MKIEEAIGDSRRIFLDTAPAIYLLERNPLYFGRMEAFFRLRREKGIILVTSPITLAECLIHPLRHNMSELA